MSVFCSPWLLMLAIILDLNTLNLTIWTACSSLHSLGRSFLASGSKIQQKFPLAQVHVHSVVTVASWSPESPLHAVQFVKFNELIYSLHMCCTAEPTESWKDAHQMPLGNTEFGSIRIHVHTSLPEKKPSPSHLSTKNSSIRQRWSAYHIAGNFCWCKILPSYHPGPQKKLSWF